MAKSVVSYNRELPFIEGRLSYEKPSSHLVKSQDGKGYDLKEGRRNSKLMMIEEIRKEVDVWRNGGYAGVSETAKELLEFWFEQDHLWNGKVFHYHFCQREAIETLIYLYEIKKIRDVEKCIREFTNANKKVNLFDFQIETFTTNEGKRKIKRREQDDEILIAREQDLPPENLARYAFKLATGSGKTWVMAMAVVYSYFHKMREENSPLSKNFLIVAPNIIVYERLESDFANGKIFLDIPLMPEVWKSKWNLKVILAEDSQEPTSSGTLFLTNIHKIYESREQPVTVSNALEAILGKAPTGSSLKQDRSMLARIRSLKDLIVLNDEAHHVHEEDLAWTQTLLSIHNQLPKGLAMWLDFSATPKDQNGMYFPWTVCDYPLSQAVEDRIVKAPILVFREVDNKKVAEDPEVKSAEDAKRKYAPFIEAAVKRIEEHRSAYGGLFHKPVLFITLEKNAYADAIAEYLQKKHNYREDEILNIHTDGTGEITKKDLDVAREAARKIDSAGNPYKVVVSVMMLREGWDVKSVTVVLGLRPFSAKSKILPEQVIGRGLRLMQNISPDNTQTLEVMGTKKLLETLQNELDQEGVGIGTSDGEPILPFTVYPNLKKIEMDISIPITKPTLVQNLQRLNDIKLNDMNVLYDSSEIRGINSELIMEFFEPRTEVHREKIQDEFIPTREEIISRLVNGIEANSGVHGQFTKLVVLVKNYLEKRCFWKEMDLENEKIRLFLAQNEVQDKIIDYISHQISVSITERRDIEIEKKKFHLSTVNRFTWRRNLPLTSCSKTIFNVVTTYNDFEKLFAKFLEKADDVIRFASLGTTEQESWTGFRIDYIKLNGRRAFYYPDWIVVQRDGKKEKYWIIETKGRIWPDTHLKDEAIKYWCETVSKSMNQSWNYFRVNQIEFGSRLRTLKLLEDVVSVLNNSEIQNLPKLGK
ncbi:MAG: DEAD/DEAH box helicase family protein [Leptospiraceae bacterium]|nr:DEAD/DEAH box helicase family protein [Leptospiraceae bacterium]